MVGRGERRGTLRYGDCVLTADCVRGLDRGGKEREKGNVTLRGLCVESRLC